MMRPSKPFDTYKWRWLSVAPTESLLEPPVLLGVLRVLARHENAAPSSPEIAAELAIVQRDTKTSVDLVRTPERNLIRNSGQYWKGTGLLMPDRGEIRLTALGHKVAEGKITQSEFAAVLVQQTVLPNPGTYTPTEIAKWKEAKLEIRPFALILEVLEELGRNHGGQNEAYVTPDELIRIIIPLAGARATVTETAFAIAAHRHGKLDISSWPDCTPAANDHRLAREFLLFLANFGICRKVASSGNREERYLLDELSDINEVAALTSASIFGGEASADKAIEAIRHSSLPSIIERQRTVSTILVRSGQSGFRNKILRAYEGRCYLTGEVISDVLEAAHIVPFENGGSHDKNNGFCLRVDIHRLYDSGNLRISPSGDLFFSDALAESKNYSSLPRKISIPPFVNPVNLKWREDYC